MLYGCYVLIKKVAINMGCFLGLCPSVVKGVVIGMLSVPQANYIKLVYFYGFYISCWSPVVKGPLLLEQYRLLIIIAKWHLTEVQVGPELCCVTGQN